jgi:hypothetical protein
VVTRRDYRIRLGIAKRRKSRDGDGGGDGSSGGVNPGGAPTGGGVG